MRVIEIITEAVDTMGLPHRGQDIPAKILTTATACFNRILKEYSGNGVLTCYQSNFFFKPTSDKATFGKFNLKKGKILNEVKAGSIPSAAGFISYRDIIHYKDDGVDVYKICANDGDEQVWVDTTIEEQCDYVPDFIVTDLSRPIKIAFKRENKWVNLTRENYADIYTTTRERAYATHPIGDGKYEIIFKGVANTDCILVYLTNISFDESSFLEVPEEYQTLIHAALCYELGVAFPALDPQKKEDARLRKNELESVVTAQNVGDFVFVNDDGDVDFDFNRIDMFLR